MPSTDCCSILGPDSAWMGFLWIIVPPCQRCAKFWLTNIPYRIDALLFQVLQYLAQPHPEINWKTQLTCYPSGFGREPISSIFSNTAFSASTFVLTSNVLRAAFDSYSRYGETHAPIPQSMRTQSMVLTRPTLESNRRVDDSRVMKSENAHDPCIQTAPPLPPKPSTLQLNASTEEAVPPMVWIVLLLHSSFYMSKSSFLRGQVPSLLQNQNRSMWT